jgi:hypothetical protein
MKLTSTYCGCLAAIALLSACSGSTQSGLTPSLMQTGSASRHASWMSPLASKKSKLLYVSNYSDNEVFVYDNLTGKQVGSLSGFSSPQGQCVDAKGDVYIANGGDGTVVEYAHGGSDPVQTFTTSGDAFGCSVDAQNDLAVTDFLGTNYAAGSITVFPKGSTKGVTYSDATDCHYIWTAGYDNKGNLIAIAENDASETVTFCAVLKGSKSKSLSLLKAKGFTIYSPNSTMWDGKYIALGDQEIGGNFESGFIEATLSGSTLKSHGQVELTDTCNGSYSHVVEPFIAGNKNTPVNDKQATTVVGSNELCNANLRAWHYPAGNNPFKSFTFQSSGQSISIGS